MLNQKKKRIRELDLALEGWEVEDENEMSGLASESDEVVEEQDGHYARKQGMIVSSAQSKNRARGPSISMPSIHQGQEGGKVPLTEEALLDDL